jgi:eukaryotic-like serine/threonine-protein kinase
MPRLEAGQEVDNRYRLIARVGSGGMADVWVADDTMLGRQVALKFLHERFAQDAQFVERFRREATAAAGLQHPNVVGVYDRGEWEGGHYIAMEYVEGATLKDLIERGLAVGEAVEIVRQVLAGASFAHGRGIVHRDLKPGNVLVDAEGRARVTDFGIARAGVSEITQTGSVLGTAHYLSPEQAQGLDVTHSSDLYSIGVLLYEALTGQVPFEGDSAVTIALRQVSEQARPPSGLNPNVTPALDAVTLRALAKDPANRFSSAEEFAAALDAAEADPSGGGLGDTASYAAVAAAGAAGAGAAIAAGASPAEAAMAQEQQAAQQDGSRWMTKRRAAILAAILLLLGAVAAYALTRPDQVKVPDTVGKSRDQAELLLDERGLESNVRSRPSCVPKGVVAEQSPAAGERADEGSTVVLTVSSGQAVTVPGNLKGKSLQTARKALKRERLLVHTRERFSKAKPGTVIGVAPAGGSEVDCRSVVNLTISGGENIVALPDVVGSQEAEAEATLRDAGFIPNVETEDADEPEGQVISQNPAAGSKLPKGETITIVVSSGAGSVVMPNVIGQSREAAQANLTSRGLDVRVVERSTDEESEDDQVLDQAPDAGERLRAGDDVTIYVGAFEEPPPPEEKPPPTDETTTTPKRGPR